METTISGLGFGQGHGPVLRLGFKAARPKLKATNQTHVDTDMAPCTKPQC